MKYSQTDLNEDHTRYLKEMRIQDELEKREAKLGLRPICPICSSHRYYQTTRVDECKDCGHYVSY